jgi:hypothetical protein
MPTQPRYLTLPDLLLNFALACGIGYLLAGRAGAAIGAAVVVARYAFLIGRSLDPKCSDGSDE